MAGKRKRTAQSALEDDEHSEDLTLDELPSVDPYATLGIEKSATSAQIRSAYHRLALKQHPDKVDASEKDTAHAKFQEIAAAYAILSDEIRRKRYDTTGRTDEAVAGDDAFDWATFYRQQYDDLISAERIDAFSKEYKGSGEEQDDVLAAFEKSQGDMNLLYEEVMLSEPTEDEDRFRKIIDEAIAAGEVDNYPKYSKETTKTRNKRLKNHKKSASKEAQEAEEMAEELGLKKGKNSMGDLAALIKQRQNGRAESFFDNLEAKYGGGTSGKNAHPPEEAFARNGAKRKKK